MRKIELFSLLALTMSLSCSGLGCGALAGSAPAALVGGSPQLDEVSLPSGFRIHTYAADVEGARSMTSGPEGVTFVGSRDPGKVYAVIDRDGDRQADETRVLGSDLNSPNGVAWKDGSLFVAEISRILRFDGVEAWLASKDASPPQPNVVFTAEHGSWNRSEPIGYRVTFVSVDGDRAGVPRNFATGFLKDGIAWGRPVDVEVLDDGSLLVSDDKADAIYRIHRP